MAYGQVERGELARGGYRVLILPRSSAMSEAEAAAIREFVHQGGLPIADGEPGVFDEHSRRLAQPRLGDLFNGGQGRGKTVRLNALAYHQQRLLGQEGELHSAARDECFEKPRTGKELTVALDPYEPALYAVSPTPVPALEVAAPARAR